MSPHLMVLEQRSRCFKCFLFLLFSAFFTMTAAPRIGATPVIAGVGSSRLDPTLKGLVLIGELNCAACHSSDSSVTSRSKQAPRLSDIGSRVNPNSIEAFIRNPHTTKPGTTMPDLLSSFDESERTAIARSLTHFLLSLRTNDFALQAPDAVAAQHGKELFHSRGCAACHSPRDAQGGELSVANSVPLGALEKKYSFKSLVRFLRQPHAVRPSGRMPDLRLPGQEIERIAHFLLQSTRVPGALGYTMYRGQVWEGLTSDQVTAERAGLVNDFSLASLGEVHHHTAIQYDGWMRVANPGHYSFFVKMNGGSLLLDGKPLIQQDPSDRRGIKTLEASTDLAEGWRRIQLTYFHTGYEPSFSFEMEGPQFARAPIPSSMLSISNQPIPVLEPLKVDAALAARGREQFSKLGCANCHTDLKLPVQTAKAFAQLDPKQGCLSAGPGVWPGFDLSAEQRGWIEKALPLAEHPELNASQRIEKTLATFNCIACHERAGLGGVSSERLSLFTGTQPTLGDQGRLPPPLTQVGAKLTREGIADVLLHGKRHRDYVNTSMPQFGESNVGALVDLFEKVDALEEAPLPKPVPVQESKNAGWEMVGTAGLSCIACHAFNGQNSGEVSAVDLSLVAQRLKRNWFHLYLRQPARFHPTVTMPSYWPDGQSVRPTILGGDTAQQIEALWVYLSDGGRARKPTGLSRESNELRVGDLTEICRGQSSVGYRGIAVGYPERIHLAFDSGEMALRLLWKGEFVNINMGSFHPRGTDRISFPPGIPFHRLKSLEESWPYKGKLNHLFPQDHGYQFRGYHLDASRRPTFLYQYGDVAVQDFFEDLHDASGAAYFRRTLRFESAAEPQPFYFRVAVGKKLTSQSERSFLVDQLRLRITSDQKGIVREGASGELLIPLTLPKGRSTLTLEYQW